MNVIETVGLTKKFGEFIANDKMNIQIKEKKITCIVGENGAGKSTLMNMLYGMFKPSSGKMFIRGEEVVLDSPLDAIGHGIGMVHQHFKLVPSLTVYENILLGVEITKGKSPFIDREKEIASVKSLIENFKFELNPLDKIENISVGCRQRVEILKMLYRKVDILILDEPTAVLTPQEVDELIVNLKYLKNQGKTIIVITHKLREVIELGDDVIVIRNGKVVGKVKTTQTSEKELAQMMVGRDVVLRIKNERKSKISDKIYYRVEEISTVDEYGKQVLDGLSFSVRKGEVLGIAGIEGNGQSELVKVLSGLMETTSGWVELLGKKVTNQWPDQLRKAGLGIIPEDRYAQGLCKEMNISENCIAGYHDLEDVCEKGFLIKKKIEKKRDNYIKEYDIRVGDAEALVSSLSGGNAQKIVIAREFGGRPKVLLACQPTRGVDVGSIEYIHNQIIKYRDEGNAVILVSSELSEILSLSDRIIVMHKGKIVGCAKPKETSAATIGLLMAGIQ